MARVINLLRRSGAVAVAISVASAFALAGEARDNRVVISLVKPALIYINGNAVSEAQLRKMIHPDTPLVIELDPEVALPTLRSLDRVLSDVKPRHLKIQAAGRWILEAVIRQRNERTPNR